jgi:hypothetical protein
MRWCVREAERRLGLEYLRLGEGHAMSVYGSNVEGVLRARGRESSADHSGLIHQFKRRVLHTR